MGSWGSCQGAGPLEPGGGEGEGGGSQGSTLGSLLRTLILPHARLCRVRRNSLSSMPDASLMSARLRLSTSLNSISTTACSDDDHDDANNNSSDDGDEHGGGHGTGVIPKSNSTTARGCERCLSQCSEGLDAYWMNF